MSKNKITLCDFTNHYDICVQCDIPRQYLCSDSSPKYMDKNEKQLFADNYKRMIDNSYLNVDRIPIGHKSKHERTENQRG